MMHLSTGDLLLIGFLILNKFDKQEAVIQPNQDSAEWEGISLNYNTKFPYNKIVNKRMISEAAEASGDRRITYAPTETTNTATTTPTTTPTTPPPPSPSQLLGVTYVDNNGVAMIVAEKGSKVNIACRCQKDITVYLKDEKDMNLQSHLCSDDFTHDFQLTVGMENFGEYRCNLNGRTSIYAYTMDYYVCDESSDVCREDAFCKDDNTYCIVTKEHPTGQKCQKLRADQCSFKYNTIYCPGDIVSMCAPGARKRATTQLTSLTATIPPADSSLLKYDPYMFNFRCLQGNATATHQYRNYSETPFDSRHIHRPDQGYVFYVVCPDVTQSELHCRVGTRKETLKTFRFTCKGFGLAKLNLDKLDAKFQFQCTISHSTWIQRLVTNFLVLKVSVRVQEHAPVKAVEKISCHVTGLSPLFTAHYIWIHNNEELSLTDETIEAKIRGSGTYKCGVKVVSPVCNPHYKYIEYIYSGELKIDITEGQSTTTTVAKSFAGNTNDFEIFESLSTPTAKPMEPKLFNLPFATGLAVIACVIAVVVVAVLSILIYIMLRKRKKTFIVRQFVVPSKRGPVGRGRDRHRSPERLIKGYNNSPPFSANRFSRSDPFRDSKRRPAFSGQRTNQNLY